MAKSLVSEIIRRAEEIPTKPAFIFLGTNSRRTVLTFGDVNNLAQKFAAVLREKGIVDGDVVCNTLANSPERLITQLGTIMAGAIFLNGQLCLADGSDFLQSVKDGNVKAIIYNPNDSRGAFKILKNKITDWEDSDKVICADISCLEMLIPCVLESNKGDDIPLFEELRNVSRKVCIDNGPKSLTAYLCTSGSTGIFKLLPATNEFLLESGYEMGMLIGIGINSVLLNDRPFGWLAGTPATVFALKCTRVTIEDTVPRGEGYDHYLRDVLQRENCTSVLVIPSLLNNLIEKAMAGTNRNRWRLLKSIGVLGAPTMKKALKSIGLLSESLVTLYGSTETAVMASMTLTRCNNDYEDFMCGSPLEETEFRIVDSNMVDVPVGQTGEILVKKNLSCTHYVNNEKATEETFLPGGWIRLGDRGFINSNGQISVLGRGAHAIMRCTDIIYPGQLEAPILLCPGLAEVIITGVPDPDKLEEVCALLVRQPGIGKEVDEAYVIDYCKKTLFVNPDNPEFNPLPKYFRFVEAIPKLENGKDDRVACKRLATSLIKHDDIESFLYNA